MSPKRKPTKPVDIYVRVSRTNGRDVEAEGGTAFEQERRTRAALEGKGLRTGEVFTDLDESGGKRSRPAFDRMMDRLRQGTSGGVIVLNLSRWGRHRNVVQDILDLEEQHGAVVISAEGELDTSTAQGRLMLGMLNEINTYYREAAGEQWGRTKHGAWERGIYVGPAPAGYDREDGRLVPNGHAEAVRAAFEARAGGASWHRTAEVLNDAGVETSRGNGVWAYAAVKTLIRNRAYTGEHTCTCGCGGVREDGHPALVSRSLWKRANDRRGRAPGTRDTDGAPLAGILRCGNCGGSMTLDQTRVDGKPYRFYRCKRTWAECSKRATVMAHEAESRLLDETIRWLEGQVATETVEQDAPGAADAELVALRAEVEAVEDGVAAGEISAAAAGRVLTRLEARREDIESREAPAEIVGQISWCVYRGMLERRDPEEPGTYRAADARETVLGMSVPERRDLMRLAVRRARVLPGRGKNRVLVDLALDRTLAGARREGVTA